MKTPLTHCLMACTAIKPGHLVQADVALFLDSERPCKRCEKAILLVHPTPDRLPESAMMSKLAVLRGVIEHANPGVFFGSTMALDEHVAMTIKGGLIREPRWHHLRRYEATPYGEFVYATSGLRFLPNGRWVGWDRTALRIKHYGEKV